MSSPSGNGMFDLGDQQLEYRSIGPRSNAAPTLVLLHEGLGCVALWNDFPERLAAATGLGVFLYSRAGYGASSTIALPRPLSYMHHEAREVLPRVLQAIGFQRGLLIGHSDGASIATIYAGSTEDHRISGLVLIAPHFFVEDMGLAAIAQAKVAFESGDLRQRLARWHQNVDAAFKGWNGAWLDPGFRAWDITDALAYIRVPVAIIQGVDDQYGTQRQIAVAEEECYCPVEVTLLEGVQHAPQRESPDRVVQVIAEFAKRTLV
ncbi:MAG TPA: alpha/beta hydrolase [Xanthobacteraceae bacterium]|jgi:pimeloyl-ACP methyl ester carboxylesterase|nr:alpha/beta hydrolase [Xanthobacteraceae bacterium]